MVDRDSEVLFTKETHEAPVLRLKCPKRDSRTWVKESVTRFISTNERHFRVQRHPM